MGQIDDISAAIGEIRAYVHEHRYSTAQLSQKFDTLPVSFRKDLVAMEAKLTSQIHEMEESNAMKLTKELLPLQQRLSDVDTRLKLMEIERIERQGVIKFGNWVLQTPWGAWILGGIVMLGSFMAGKFIS